MVLCFILLEKSNEKISIHCFLDLGMTKKIDIDNYTKISSVTILIYNILELYHPSWYSYNGIGEYIICIGAPLWFYGLYRTLPHLVKYYKKD